MLLLNLLMQRQYHHLKQQRRQQLLQLQQQQYQQCRVQPSPLPQKQLYRCSTSTGASTTTSGRRAIAELELCAHTACALNSIIAHIIDIIFFIFITPESIIKIRLTFIYKNCVNKIL